MANHIGPSPLALEAMRDAVDAEHVGPYSPDLDEPLRDLMAEALLGRARDDGFDVIGTEGAQAGVGYAALACLDPGDEAIVTDPGLLPLRPGAEAGGRGAGVGAAVRGERVAARPRRGRRRRHAAHEDGGGLRPGEPVRDGPGARGARGAAAPVGRARIVILADTTHSHIVDPGAQAPSDRRRRRRPPGRDVPGVERPGARLRDGGRAGGRAGRRPALVRACLQVKIAAVRLNTNRVAQVGAAAALRDEDWIRGGEEVIRRNLAPLKAIATPVIDPAYGFSCVVDVSGTGASAQELTAALCRRRVAVYPGDGLGEVGATTTIRLNLSDPDPSALERFAAAYPEAVEEAASGTYRDAVRDLFLSYGTDRGRRIAALVEGGG